MVIGYAYVVADLIHIGHLKHLKRCKDLCEYLVVGVLTDEACMEKKPKPIIPFDERIEVVRALGCVDKAVVQLDYSPIGNVVTLDPDVLFESVSHSKEAINEAKKIVRTLVLPYYEGQSTTKIKNLIKNES